MKTKISLTMLFLALVTSVSWAQKSVSIHSAKAGNLYERRENQEFIDELKGTTNLTVTGILNATDFRVINHSLSNTLKQIDLSGVTSIEAYTGDQGPAGAHMGHAFYNAGELPQYSFQTFYELTEIVLPKNLQSIGNGAFQYSYSLAKLDVPSSVKYISGENTFQETALATINLPDDFEIKQRYYENEDYRHEMVGTFSDTYIKSFHVPANVTKIDGAFSGAIESLTFAKNSRLESFEGLYGSEAIKELVFPEGLKTLAGLDMLNSLEYLKLPSTLESISATRAGSFFSEDIGSLKTIVSHALFPPEIDREITFEGIPDKSKVTLFVPSIDAVANYKQAAIWKDFTIKVIGSDAQSQTIDNFSDIVVAVGEGVTLGATASSKLPVTYSIADASIATLSGNKLTILKEGETTITAKQAGDGINFQAVEKTVKLIVMNLSWLEAPTILISGSSAKIVGPAEAAAKFTKFYVNDAEVELKSGVADLTDKKGELSLKATTADGTEVIKLKINKQ